MAYTTGTVTFSFTGISGGVKAVKLSGASREALNTSTLATTGKQTFIPAKDYNPGEVTIEAEGTNGALSLLTGAIGTLTITGAQNSLSSSAVCTGVEASWDGGLE